MDLKAGKACPRIARVSFHRIRYKESGATEKVGLFKRLKHVVRATMHAGSETRVSGQQYLTYKSARK